MIRTIDKARRGGGWGALGLDDGLEALSRVTMAITITYTYDPLNRLTAAEYSNGNSYYSVYDVVGNRTQ